VPRAQGVEIDTVRCIGNNFDNLDCSHLITPAIVLAASTGATYHTGENWLEVLMKVRAGGHPYALDITGCPVDTIDRKFDDLFVPFI
jgi:hypothetical protein